MKQDITRLIELCPKCGKGYTEDDYHACEEESYVAYEKDEWASGELAL